MKVDSLYCSLLFKIHIKSPSYSKTLEVDIYHFAIQKRNIHTTPPLDYAILLRLSVTQDFALAYLHKAKNFFEDYGHNLLQSK